MSKTVRCSLVLLAALMVTPAFRESPAPADATGRIVAAAQTVLKSLDDGQRAKVQFRWDDAGQRSRWSNLPSPMFERQG